MVTVCGRQSAIAKRDCQYINVRVVDLDERDASASRTTWETPDLLCYLQTHTRIDVCVQLILYICFPKCNEYIIP